MKNSNCKSIVFWISISEGAGILSGLLSQKGMQIFSESINKPPLTPPGILFPIVWGILYALMGISVSKISSGFPGNERNQSVNLFVIQLILNFFWSPIFFNAQAYGFAIIWLLILSLFVIWMIRSFYPIEPVAAYLQIPYLLWLCFATYLACGVWYLN